MKLSHLFFVSLIYLLFIFPYSYSAPLSKTHSYNHHGHNFEYDYASYSEHPYRFIFLKYYQIGNEKKDPKNSVSLEQFLSHTEEFKKKEYHVAYFGHYSGEMKEAENAKRGYKPIRKYVHFSFDGVHQSFYKEAFPVFKKLRWPFILFLNTDKIGKDPNYLNWDQLREIVAYPKVSIGCQTHTGKSVVNMEFVESIRELFTCLSMVRKNLGIDVRLFSYPKGEFDTQSYEFIKSLNYLKIETFLKYIFAIRKIFMDLDISLEDYNYNGYSSVIRYAFTEVPNVYNNNQYLGSSDHLLPRIKLNFNNANKENFLKMITYSHIPAKPFGSTDLVIDSSIFSKGIEDRKNFFRLWVTSLFTEKIKCYGPDGKSLERVLNPKWVPKGNSNFKHFMGIAEHSFFVEFKIPQKLKSLRKYLIYCTHPSFKKGQKVRIRKIPQETDEDSDASNITDKKEKLDHEIPEDTDPYKNYYYLINPDQPSQT